MERLFRSLVRVEITPAGVRESRSMTAAGSIAFSRGARVSRRQIDAREINHHGDVGLIPFTAAQRRRARPCRFARIEDHAVRPRQFGAEIANCAPIDRHRYGRRILRMCRFRDERCERCDDPAGRAASEERPDGRPLRRSPPSRDGDTPSLAARCLAAAGCRWQRSKSSVNVAGRLLAGGDGATVHHDLWIVREELDSSCSAPREQNKSDVR